MEVFAAVARGASNGGAKVASAGRGWVGDRLEGDRGGLDDAGVVADPTGQNHLQVLEIPFLQDPLRNRHTRAELGQHRPQMLIGEQLVARRRGNGHRHHATAPASACGRRTSRKLFSKPV